MIFTQYAINKFSPYFAILAAVVAGISAVYIPIPIMLAALTLATLFFLIIESPLTLLTLLLVLAPLRTLIATESTLSLPLDIGQLLLIVYLGGWTVYRIYHKKPLLKNLASALILPLVGLTVMFGLNVWSSVAISAWVTEWLKWMIIGFFVWHLALSEQKNWKWLLAPILVSALANAIVGLYIFFGGSGADHLVIGGRFFRAFGTFGQPNPFGGFMGITIPIALMGAYGFLLKLWQRYKSNQNISLIDGLMLGVFVVIAAILFAALIASWSRGAWLGFIISLGVMAFAIPRRLSVSTSVSLGLAVLLLLLWFGGLIPQSIVARLTTAATDFITIEEIRGVDITSINYAVVERIAHWQAAINMSEANPIFGIGLGNYEIVYDQYRLLNWKEPLGHAHNYYLNILAETGIIGVLTYITFWGSVFAISWNTRQHPDLFTRSIVIGLLGSWTYIAVHSLFDNLYVNNLFLHIGLLLSILSILHLQIGKTITLE